MKRGITEYYQFAYKTFVDNLSTLIYIGVFILVSSLILNFLSFLVNFTSNMIISIAQDNEFIISFAYIIRIVIAIIIGGLATILNLYLTYGSLAYIIEFIKGNSPDSTYILQAGSNRIFPIIVIGFVGGFVSLFSFGIAGFLIPLSFLYDIYFQPTGIIESFTKVISDIFKDVENLMSYILFGLIYIVILVVSTSCCSILTVFSYPLLLLAIFYLFIDIYNIEFETNKDNDLSNFPINE